MITYLIVNVKKKKIKTKFFSYKRKFILKFNIKLIFQVKINII